MKRSESSGTPKAPTGFGFRRLVRGGLAVSPPFLALILWLVIHHLGWVEHDWRITRERTLILFLLLCWALATLLVAAMTRRPSTARIWARRLAAVALLAASTLLSAVFAEVVLRTLRPQTTWQLFRIYPSPKYHHRNSAGVYGTAGDGIRITTNEDGFRGSPDRAELQRYPHRIAVLGDSFTFGLGVSDEHVSTVVLERALRDRLGDDAVAVVNTGALSYSPLLVRTLFRDVVAEYRPTLTLLLLDVGDVGDDHRYSQENVATDPDETLFRVPARSGPTLCDRLALCRVSRGYMEQLGIPREIFDLTAQVEEERYDYYEFQVEVGGVTENNRFFVLRHPLEQTRPYFERTLGYVSDIAADAAEVGSELVLVITPRFFHWNDEECPNNWEKKDYGVDEPYEHEYFRFFETAAPEAGIRVFSLLPAFLASDTFPLVFDHDPHWNEAGHRLVGEALADYLVAEGLIR